MKNIFILAAENSAENYGSRVVDRFNTSARSQVTFFGVGGDRFIERGVDIIIHNREFSVIGIIEIISSIFKFKRYMKQIVRQIRIKNAAAALLIDFPDFNLRLAKKLKKLGIPVYYYISTTVWAWRYSRVNLIKKYVDHLFIIFPFEKKIYEREKIPFTYTGHPLISMIKIKDKKQDIRMKLGLSNNQLLISLLPGSRLSEVKFMLPEMVRSIKLMQEKLNLKAFILRAHNIDKLTIKKILDRENMPIQLIDQPDGQELINGSDFVITTCGTSNLEIAMIGVPFVSCYRVNRLSYILGIHFIKIKLYSIVNILANQKIIPELIQKNFNAKNIFMETLRILENQNERRHMLAKFREIKTKLKQDIDPPEIIFKKIYRDLFPPKNPVYRKN
jgi:lipid-A-disaccharide synthase